MTASALPQELGSYLRTQLDYSRRALCLALDADLCLSEWKGDPGYYGIPPLTAGMPMDDTLPWLVGTLESKYEQPEVLPFIETDNGRSVEVHLVPLPSGWGVLLLDSSAERDRQLSQQQVANEVQLLQRRQARLLEELRQAHAELEDKNRELDRANQAKSRFIASMSHEFRTPITSVLGYTKLLRETTGKAREPGKHLDAIDRGTRHLLALVDNLLEQAGIENGKLEITPVSTNLTRLFAEVMDLFQSLVQNKGLQLRFQSAGEFPRRVWIDELRLRQILINLLGNATKFTQQGSVTLSADWRAGILSLAVTDTGPGIPAAARARIFRAFEQCNQDQRLQGAGLGLAISSKLAQRMGGDLQLDQEIAQGSRFCVSLPAEIDQTSKSAAQPQYHAAHANASILVAEDDPDIRALMELTLASTPYQVDFVENGQQALETALAAPPDLVLMDMNMPVMDGLSAARELRRQGYTKPIVALTASSSGTPRDQAYAAGCDHYLSKPLNLDRLHEIILDLLG